MSKKKRQKTTGGEAPAISAVDGGEGISSRGKKVIAGGMVLVAVGFMVLTKADPMGRNWAASLSPFLILGGYACVGWGIFLPEKTIKAEPPSSNIPS
ncbi:MAG: hypothetical protein HYZ75_00750 [Elusimicrobia bacterium]|nr:hypothetical protein [Elusimicrobiota bacterium]